MVRPRVPVKVRPQSQRVPGDGVGARVSERAGYRAGASGRHWTVDSVYVVVDGRAHHGLGLEPTMTMMTMRDVGTYFGAPSWRLNLSSVGQHSSRSVRR